MQMNTKLSIITINRNNVAGLRKTIESVLSQTYRDFEYIIVDGASTDESVEVIKASALQAEGLDFYWISEPDRGIYNAMNKGIEIALGKRVVDTFNRSERSEDNKNKILPDYIQILNSGDYLVDEHVVERIMPILDGTDIIQGNNIEEINNKIYRNRGYGKSDIDMFDILKGYFLHQGSFCKRDLFDKYGYFDESYRISGDTKFFMDCLGIHDATFKYIDLDITNYDCNGVSAPQSGEWNKQGRSEYARIKGELFSRRMEEHFENNEKKVRLYNKLHQQKWIWGLVMFVSKLYDIIYGEYPFGVKREKIK